jgi:hypothetical protein
MMNDKGETALQYGPNGEMFIADWAQERLLRE